jgi:hypothetical protein
MPQAAWSATGVIEASPERVAEVLLTVTEGPINAKNAPLLRALPGAGPLLARATLKGGPNDFTVHYGRSDPGGTVRVDRDRGYFSFRGGYKFGADYHFTPHPKGTLLTYKTFNVAPEAHRNRRSVRFQFWLGGKLKIGLRGGLRRIGKVLDCRTYPGT